MHRVVLTSILAAAAAAPVAAQIPAGNYVVSSLSGQGIGLGGLAVVDSRVPGPAARLTGLPPAVRGDNSSTAGNGANAVAILSATELLVGTRGTTVELYRLELGGLAVQTATSVSLGAGTFPIGRVGGVNDLEVLPDGDVVFCVSNVAAAGPLGGSAFGRFDRSSNTVSPLAVTGLPSTFEPEFLALAPSGDSVYAVGLASFNGDSVVFEFATGGGPARELYRQSGQLVGLAARVDGTLVAYSGPSAAPGELLVIEPLAGATTSLGSARYPAAFALERTSDAPIYVVNPLSWAGEVTRFDVGSGPQILTTLRGGLPSGIDVLDNPRTYGDASPASEQLVWRTRALPDGGAPRVGQTDVVLALDGPPASTLVGMVMASFDDANTTMLGVRVLVGPTHMVPLIGSISVRQPLTVPIPPLATPGATACVQAFFPDPAAPFGVAASDGLRIELQR